MPRLNLSDAEAALIEKLRARNAQTLGFNAGVEATLQWCADFLRPHEPGQIVDDMVNTGKRLLIREIKS